MIEFMQNEHGTLKVYNFDNHCCVFGLKHGSTQAFRMITGNHTGQEVDRSVDSKIVFHDNINTALQEDLLPIVVYIRIPYLSAVSALRTDITNNYEYNKIVYSKSKYREAYNKYLNVENYLFDRPINNSPMGKFYFNLFYLEVVKYMVTLDNYKENFLHVSQRYLKEVYNLLLTIKESNASKLQNIFLLNLDTYESSVEEALIDDKILLFPNGDKLNGHSPTITYFTSILNQIYNILPEFNIRIEEETDYFIKITEEYSYLNFDVERYRDMVQKNKLKRKKLL